MEFLSRHHRLSTTIVLLTLALTTFVTARSAGSQRATSLANPIIIENQNTGTSDWQLTNPGNDTDHQIKGFASKNSVNIGEEISFHVSVAPAQKFEMAFYRMGWYGGAGGRLIMMVEELDGVTQSPVTVDPITGLIIAPWESSYDLTIPEEWVSGVYLVKLTNAESFQNYIVFTVRNDQQEADLLYQRPVTTDQAYNNYPHDRLTGKSLYVTDSFGEPTIAGTNQAVKVSFDRPYAKDGSGRFFEWEYHLIRWLERTGYNLTYATNIDTHRDGEHIQDFKGWLSAGHDEYWTKEMRDSVEAARDAGTNIAFFGANASYLQIRLEPSASGVQDRIVVAYKRWGIDPIQDHSRKTVLWREIRFREEQRLVGVQYISYNSWPDTNMPYVVQNSNHWIYSGTGFSDGDSVAGIIGYEVDQRFTDVPLPEHKENTYTLLSESPYVTSYKTTVTAHSSIYQAPSGAWVFGSGTLSWSWGLDKLGLEDSRLQRTTSNLLNCFISTDPAFCSQDPPPAATPNLSTLTPTLTPIPPTPTPSSTPTDIPATSTSTSAPTSTPTATATHSPTPTAVAPTPSPQDVNGISGQVTDRDGNGISNVSVAAYQQSATSAASSVTWNLLSTAESDSNGHYGIQMLPAGVYRVGFSAQQSAYHTEFYPNVYYLADGLDVVLKIDSIITQVNAELELKSTFNVPPRGHVDEITVAEGDSSTMLQNGTTSLLMNDEDVEAEPIKAVLVDAPEHGSFTLNEDGTFSYTHDGSEGTTDSLSYQVDDGVNLSELTDVHIAILPINDPPIAFEDVILASLEQITITVAKDDSLLNNDQDVDSETLTAHLVDPPQAGELTLNLDGTFVYIHDGSDTLVDTFTYMAKDGEAESNVVQVRIEMGVDSESDDAIRPDIYLPLLLR